MKKATLLIALLFVKLAVAGDSPSVHGMLVVGHEHVYLSHLPMFHNPHDYQGIFEAKLSAEAKAIYLKDQADHPEQKIYTLAPRPFVLPERVANPKPFLADLYRGHFERGGVVIARQIQVGLSQVIIFKKFDPTAVHPAHPEYLAFGTPDGEQFLAHLITARPDFDQIVQTHGIGGAMPQILQFAELSAETPLIESAGHHEIYLETGDLE